MTLLVAACDIYIEPSPTPSALVVPAFNATPSLPSVVEMRRERRRDAMTEILTSSLEEETDWAGPSALGNFDALLRLLPDEFPATEPRLIRDGAIGLDWDRDPDNQFSIILLPRDRIAFAAYFSGERLHGTTDFLADKLPIALSQAAYRWLQRRTNTKAVA